MASVLTGPDAHLQRVQRKICPQRFRQLPADHAAGEHIDDERGIHPAREGSAVGDVRDPQLVRSGRGEVAFDQVRASVWAVAGCVVRGRFSRLMPRSPSALISRSTVQRATATPSRRS